MAKPPGSATAPSRWLREHLLVEPPRPRRIARDPRAAWLTVATVSVGAFMGQLDASIVNIAYPSLQRSFHASLGAVQWVGLSYLLVLIAAVAAVGRVADMLGRKLLYTYGFAVFGLGSALCAIAPSLALLDVFRVVQAIGAVMLQANSIAIIAASLPREKLGRGIGVQGTAQALGLAFGPFVGGLLIGLGGWRLIFLVNVPIAALGLITAWLFVPRSRELGERERFDWIGLALFTPGLAALLLALSFGNERGWSSTEVLALFAVSFAAIVAFVVHEVRADQPLIELALFRRRRFSIGVCSGLASYLVLFGVLFVTPFLLERTRGLSPGMAGLLLTALPLAMAVAAPFAGRMTDRIGGRFPTILGMLITAGGLWLAAARPTTAGVLVGLSIAGVGIGLFTPANNASVMSSVPPRRVGVASGVINLTRGLGAALGLSLTALVFDRASHFSKTAAATSDGFTRSLVMLAVIALVAAGLSLLRRPKAQERDIR
ncbi:MAG TPA: DHA2 family efflux MFS transporter permease subunit [Gaiellaceae bacterium]|nr:DHA2 family efflux MFS transporter permease subunit [Gaiellaceae bacterium]